MTEDEHQYWDEVDKQNRKRNTVTMTAKDVAKFFAALDPKLPVQVLDQGYEDDDLSQWYSYRISFSVIQADRILDVVDKIVEQAQTIREFHRTTTPWLQKSDTPPRERGEEPF